MTGRATTSLKLDVETKDRLQRLASARRRSAHWLMREAIEQYIERHELATEAHRELRWFFS